ncbi:hypothetical protein FGO68_gene14623 [Halteria grandinella]|uniref:Uncharacterized protein n=1 Tax=Halteria grandinella TaxID=5974 RepID=A0A8J8NH66_HALGN|nr:hypothetical protein FGO68_gene14623 [Halteria grandinella]
MLRTIGLVVPSMQPMIAEASAESGSGSGPNSPRSWSLRTKTAGHYGVFHAGIRSEVVSGHDPALSARRSRPVSARCFAAAHFRTPIPADDPRYPDHGQTHHNRSATPAGDGNASRASA